jgi:hypothetical protein
VQGALAGELFRSPSKMVITGSLKIVVGGHHLLLASGASTVSNDHSDHPGDKLLRLVRDDQIELNVVEGLRLVVAFRKIKDPSDRRVLIELAERLAK